MDYNYPLRGDWSTDEIIAVTSFYTVIERAYEEGVQRTEVLEAYREFKKIVPSMSEEKTLFREFEQASGYKSYPIVRDARNSDGDKLIKGT
ncbi:UPF0223 family protein [Sporosarcina ureilytica]|uniref:Uncharacterized protein n=1 Tax=Sporosarcina ureilytica TaxID=298596 RepID=A0A1D8JI81_9BACL|nr:UPF0223 family protein [Sporosarcina ureilytica]AOV08393.1 hypothetical protein BI350_13170 [Sporosarcina ureilytica]